jgi:hypothetical protein
MSLRVHFLLMLTSWPVHAADIATTVNQRNQRYTEDHAFFNGWLTEFTDSAVASLICPRPLLIQHGKPDHIAHWPQVVEEFDAARKIPSAGSGSSTQHFVEGCEIAQARQAKIDQALLCRVKRPL